MFYNRIIFRFTVGTLVVVTIVMALFAFYDYKNRSVLLNEAYDEKFDLIMGNLENALSASLVYFDLNDIDAILTDTMNVTGIISMNVAGAKGENLSAFAYDENGQVIKIPEPKITEFFKRIDLVNRREKVLGSLTINIDKTPVNQQLNTLVVNKLIEVFSIVALLTAACILMMRVLISKPIDNVSIAMRDIAHGNGDLTQRLPSPNTLEMSYLAKYFNDFVARIQSVVTKVANNTESLYVSTQSLEKVVINNASLIESQKTQIDKVVLSTEQMNEMVSVINDDVKVAEEAVAKAELQTDQARSVVNATVDSVKKLSGDFGKGTDSIKSVQKNVTEIVSVLDVIRSIAEQTNLLALNAAIEAARAGEQGRGFAVVADEVRALAARTQKSTGEIQDMIERLQEGTNCAVEVMLAGSQTSEQSVQIANSALGNINEIVDSFCEIAGFNQRVSESSNQQNEISTLVNDTIIKVSEIAAEINSVSGHVKETSDTVGAISHELKTITENFKV